MTAAESRETPYKIVAGTTPCEGGWLLVSAKIKGATFAPEFPRVMERLYDIFNHRPSYSIIAMNAPIGAPSQALTAGRHCDREASQLTGVDVTLSRWPSDVVATDSAHPASRARAAYMEERIRE